MSRHIFDAAASTVDLDIVYVVYSGATSVTRRIKSKHASGVAGWTKIGIPRTMAILVAVFQQIDSWERMKYRIKLYNN